MEWVIEPTDKDRIEPEWCLINQCGAKGCIIDCFINFG